MTMRNGDDLKRHDGRRFEGNGSPRMPGRADAAHSPHGKTESLDHGASKRVPDATKDIK